MKKYLLYFQKKNSKAFIEFRAKVRNIKFHHPVQKIVLNAEGYIIQKAWGWKKSGQYTLKLKLLPSARLAGMLCWFQFISQSANSKKLLNSIEVYLPEL